MTLTSSESPSPQAPSGYLVLLLLVGSGLTVGRGGYWPRRPWREHHEGPTRS